MLQFFEWFWNAIGLYEKLGIAKEIVVDGTTLQVSFQGFMNWLHGDLLEKGESLSAAFALHFVKEMREKEHIRRVNEENGKKAPPPVEGQGSNSDYFSPEAVKSMSRKEIRANYDKILSSMEKWN